MKAILALENGAWYEGEAAGALGETGGEVVFNTAMTGYQEVLTDPSYAGQIVAMTCPEIGNYGISPEDGESRAPQVAGFIVRDESPVASNWRADGTLRDYLVRHNVVAISDIDTRALTRVLRSAGVMRGIIATGDVDPGVLVEQARAVAPMVGADLVLGVTCEAPFDWKPSSSDEFTPPPERQAKRPLRVAAYDFGMKRNILRLLADAGCETTVVPATTPASDVIRGGYDGVFLSNGPGDPAATTYGVNAAGAFLGRLPVFGICLGHQLLALALGGRTFKMPFGHRGVNQPVRDVATGRVEVTSHNHGFAVDPDGWAREGNRADTSLGGLELSHWNLNDGTLEGLRCLDVPAFSVQYHPEAAPGPHDSRSLFRAFGELMAA